MRVVIAGGGTGGHFYPLLVVARKMKGTHEVLFVGSRKGLEQERISREGFRFSSIDGEGIGKILSMRTVRALFSLSRGFFQSRSILKAFQPGVVVGGGGYVSAPVIGAAWSLRIPVVLLEQNLWPGRVTRFLAPLATKILVSFEETLPNLPPGKVAVTGNPVRESIITATREEGCRALGLDPARFTLMVSGASQGARSINEAILRALPELAARTNWQIIHLVGEKHFPEIQRSVEPLNLQETSLRYLPFPYLEEVAHAYAACDLILGRAGATTLAEILARGIPAILVPYPYAAEAHQEKNARWLEKNGGGKILTDEEIRSSSFSLSSFLIQLAGDRESLQQMGRTGKSLFKEGAEEKILEVITEIGGIDH